MRLPLSLAALNAAVLAGAVLAAATGAPGESTLATAPAPVAPAPVAPAPVPAVPSPSVAPSPVPAAPPAAPKPRVQASARPAPSPAPVRVRRVVTRTGYAPYATVGPVTLHFPGDVVEVVGLHQSGHDGALPQSPVESRARVGLLGSRARDTNPQGAADIVVDPRQQVRSPVTGTVLRAGTYTLYCDHVDDFLVVEPDGRPGWEVKLLHFEGISVSKGDRVEAGVTVVGSRARVLPFASQIDKHTVAPHWPHLHIEVVDTAVVDRASGRSCT